MYHFEANFADNLRQQREAANLTQRQLGQRLGIGGSSISLWESGTRLPTISHLFLLCKALRCSADELLGLHSQPKTTTGCGLEWVVRLPVVHSINYNNSLLDGIRLFNLIVNEKLSLSQIQRQDEPFNRSNEKQMMLSLNAALLTGSIEITNVERDPQREKRLQSKYQLQHCLVANLDGLPHESTLDSAVRTEAVAALAAAHCPPLLKGLDCVGMGGGNPVARFFDLIPPAAEDLFGITWISLLATRRHLSFSPAGLSANGIVSRLLYKHPNTRGYTMPFLNQQRRSQEHYDQANTEERLDLDYARFVKRRAAQAQAVFLVAGVPELDYNAYDAELIMPELIDLLQKISPTSRTACCGDTLLHLIDQHGQPLGSTQEQQMNANIVFGLNLQELQTLVNRSSMVWLMAAKPEKSQAVKAVLKGKLANCLIISSDIADALL